MLGVRLSVLCVVYALFHSSSSTDTSSIEDKDNNNNAIVAVETEEDTAEDFVTKLDVQFGKDVYDPDLPEFEPTDDWKPVRQGQAIPRGLHVRLNLETGEKEAKLLPEDDGKRFLRDKSKKTAYSGQGHPSRLQSMKDEIEMAMKNLEKEKNEHKYWKEGEREGMMNTNKKAFSRQELKEALKNFKANKDDTKESVETKENVYRHINAIKKDFADLKMEMKSDFEILQELLIEYNNTEAVGPKRVNLLTDFEYYLHQVDNAQLFAEMGGLEMIISDLNSTDEAVRSEAAFAIGSAVQSNPSVQIKALEGAVMQQLIRMLSTEQETKVRNRVMYALASLIRHFPFAQQNFLKLGGLTAVTYLFKEPNAEKLQLKAVTLITDILIEIKTNMEFLQSKDIVAKERAEQYKNIPLRTTLFEHGWCSSLPSLLSTTEHDAREKALNAMKELTDDCWPSFGASLDMLQNLRKEYEALSAEEHGDKDQYFTGILNSVKQLIRDITVLIKNEL